MKQTNGYYLAEEQEKIWAQVQEKTHEEEYSEEDSGDEALQATASLVKNKFTKALESFINKDELQKENQDQLLQNQQPLVGVVYKEGLESLAISTNCESYQKL